MKPCPPFFRIWLSKPDTKKGWTCLWAIPGEKEDDSLRINTYLLLILRIFFFKKANSGTYPVILTVRWTLIGLAGVTFAPPI